MPTRSERFLMDFGPPPGYAGGYGGGYAPSRGYGTLQSLLMDRGRLQAEAAQRSGDIWGNALQNIGQTIAGGIQQHQEQQALKKRDAAWLGFINEGKWMTDPKVALTGSIAIWGPQEGQKQFQALLGASQLSQPKRNPEADQKALGYLGVGLKGMDEGGRALAWPQVVALTRNVYPEMKLPDQYDPKVWTQLEPVIDQLAGGKGGESFTLKPGEQRFDASGKPLAAVPEPPKEAKKYAVTVPGPGGVPIQRLATEEEMAAGVQAYRAPREPRAPEPLVPIIGPDGQSVLVPRSQAVGKRPASGREQGRPVTSGDANRLADLDTSLNDLSTLDKTLSGNKATGAAAKVGAMLPNVVTEYTGIGEEAKSKQATIDRVKQVIGKALEGGVLRKEDEYKYEKILPTIGDPPAVVQAKLKGLERAITQRKQTLIDSLSDAGYETGRYQGRSGPGAPPALTPADEALLKKYGY